MNVTTASKFFCDFAFNCNVRPYSKAVVLQVGDRVVFRMREGKQGGHLGVYRIQYEAPPTRSFFSIMGC